MLLIFTRTRICIHISQIFSEMENLSVTQPQNTFGVMYFPHMSLFTVNDKFCVICVQCNCTVNMKDQHIGLCKVLSLLIVTSYCGVVLERRSDQNYKQEMVCSNTFEVMLLYLVTL